MTQRFLNSRKQAGLLAAALLMTAAVGCGDGLKLVPVEGKVTLGGEPLAEADVIFQPENGRPSMGTTDAQGHYKLVYTNEKDGALPGTHKVVITTYVEPDSDYEAPDRRAGRPERVPAKYNFETTLQTELSPDTSDPVDFTLEAEGEIYHPDGEEESYTMESDG